MDGGLDQVLTTVGPRLRALRQRRTELRHSLVRTLTTPIRRLTGQVAERFRIVFRGALPAHLLEIVERRRIEWLSHGARATIPV